MQSNKTFRSLTASKLGDGASETMSIQNMFELEFHYQLFISRCQDTGQKPDMEKAKMFKESFNKINSKKFPQILNLYSMRLGVNTIMKLISILETQKFKVINLADNSISEYGMHAIKNLLSSCNIECLNIASNMISEIGLSLILDEIIKNNSLKMLDLGIMEGSIRKNSIGIDGARCLAAILLQNKTLECLKLEDNDIGISGAEILSIPLKRNKVLKELKFSQNLIKTQGAEYILQNAIHLQILDLGKNFIKSSIGPSLEKYFQINKNLKKINLELNELLGEGAKILFEGVINSNVTEVNLRGNGLSNRGVSMIASVLIENGRVHQNLKVLDLSSNDITEEGVNSLAAILDHLELTSLNLSKNSIGDDGIISFFSKIKEASAANTLERLDISNSKMSDRSFLFILETLKQFPELRHIKCSENYISEKYEKVYAQMLQKNSTLISLNLQGNRISLSGLKAMKKVIDRNLKAYEQKEPKKMKSQIYNMKEKQKKIKQAQQKLQKQKAEIQHLEQSKTRLIENLGRLEREEKQKRVDFEESIRKRVEEIDSLAKGNTEKMEDLQKMKLEKQSNLNELSETLDKLRERRKQLEYQLNVIRNEGELIEEQFYRKTKMMS